MCTNYKPLNTPRGAKEKSKKIRRKCATVAPYSILYRFLCNALQRARENPKKYGANAPQLHPIRCSIDFCVMLCNEQGKIQKIRRKRATVAPYLPACSLIP